MEIPGWLISLLLKVGGKTTDLAVQLSGRQRVLSEIERRALLMGRIIELVNPDGAYAVRDARAIVEVRDAAVKDALLLVDALNGEISGLRMLVGTVEAPPVSIDSRVVAGALRELKVTWPSKQEILKLRVETLRNQLEPKHRR